MKKLLLLGLLCPLFASAGILEDALLCEKKFTPEQIKTALTEYGNQRYPTGSNRQEFTLKKPISYNGLEFNKGFFVNYIEDDYDESHTRFVVIATSEQAAKFIHLIADREQEGIIKLTRTGAYTIECKLY